MKFIFHDLQSLGSRVQTLPQGVGIMGRRRHVIAQAFIALIVR